MGDIKRYNINVNCMSEIWLENVLDEADTFDVSEDYKYPEVCVADDVAQIIAWLDRLRELLRKSKESVWLCSLSSSDSEDRYWYKLWHEIDAALAEGGK